MKKVLLALTISAVSLSSFATIDSYVKVSYPVSVMHNEGICLVPSIAHDGISNIGTAQTLAASALNGPFKIAGMQAGEDSEGLVNANILSGSGVSVSFLADMESDTFDKGELTIDASEATSAAGSDKEKRAAVIGSVKVALVAGIANTLNGVIKSVKVTLKGLPDQKGLSKTIPASFKSNFTKSSPFLASLRTELNVREGADKCNE